MAIQRKLLDCFAALAMTVLVLWAAPASAQNFPKLTGRVVDQAELLRPEQELDISSKSQTLEAQTGRQFVVATVKSLDGLPIEDYAYQLGRRWGIGQAKEDDGVILLVAPNERKVWITTGYGAGGFLTDAMSGVIVREKILPEFKKNPPDYGAGITAGRTPSSSRWSFRPTRRRPTSTRPPAGESAAERRRGFHPGHFYRRHFLRDHRFAFARHERTALSPPPWRNRSLIVLWGLNELSRGSRNRGGWAAAVAGAVEAALAAAAGSAEAGASPVAEAALAAAAQGEAGDAAT
ncbi:TPM domain-containing protein [Sphingomonas daechungensis]|uniref:TPM domain-containing protein n=1 Tax=Sphingomonas daechungensis TaxID=1176646 RepID=UPI001CB9294D|nr:TPM domain-containing protein [Sphingomonas daechungensis]